MREPKGYIGLDEWGFNKPLTDELDYLGDHGISTKEIGSMIDMQPVSDIWERLKDQDE